MTNKSKNIENRIFGTLDKIKESIAQANQTLLKVADDTVEGSLKAGKEWQKVMEASLKKSEKLLQNQQELAFEALKGIKAIHLENRKRFSKLFQEERAAVKKAGAKAGKKVADAAAVVEEVKKNPGKAPAKAEMKDLKEIKGIGPKLEEILNANGVQSVEDIDRAPIKRLEEILEKAGPRYKSFDPRDWKKQAKELL